ncbi:MAG: hypothetical protein JWR15_3598 [Prosthecobacter sp.]|nr:hypothetical protein [Prosthecobacter sp.]
MCGQSQSKAVKIGLAVLAAIIVGYFGFRAYDATHFSERRALRALQRLGIQSDNARDRAINESCGLFNGPVVSIRGIRANPDFKNRTVVDIDIKFVYHRPLTIQEKLKKAGLPLTTYHAETMAIKERNQNSASVERTTDTYEGPAVAFFDVYTNGHCLLQEVQLPTNPPIFMHPDIDPEK